MLAVFAYCQPNPLVIFYIAAPPGNPEIWWMRPLKGSVTGGEEIGIIGKKFLKGLSKIINIDSKDM